LDHHLVRDRPAEAHTPKIVDLLFQAEVASILPGQSLG
jgi:hypothetical protein